jgi:hypothetical protein
LAGRKKEEAKFILSFQGFFFILNIFYNDLVIINFI